MNNVILRAVSAACALALFLVLLIWGPRSMTAVVLAACTGIGCRELYLMTFPQHVSLSKYIVFSGILVSLSGLLQQIKGDYSSNFPIFVLALCTLILLSAVWANSATRRMPHIWGASIGIVVIISIPMALLISLLKYPDGRMLLLYLMLVLAANDIGAYISGKLLGKHHMLPSVSPNKTWEGSIGGILSSAACSIGLTSVLPTLEQLTMSQVGWVVMGIALAVLGQIGDLSVSHLKRIHAMKDSGRFMPGHGGVLDRMDSYLLAAPVWVLCVTLFI